MSQIQKRKDSGWRAHGLKISIPLFLILLIFLFQESIYELIREENYVTTHLIIEFFIIIVTATIAMQAWMVFPHTLSNRRLILGSLFFTITLMEIGHAISYKGMPFFFIESSPYQATWFFILNRLILALGFLLLVLLPEKKVPPQSRWIGYGSALLYTLIWYLIIYAPVQLLPALVIEGIGTTSLKNALQYLAFCVQLIIMAIIILQRKTNKFFYLMLFVSSSCIAVSDLLYTMYTSVYGWENFMGHMFQVISYYYLLRALYYTSVEEPFQRQKEAEEQERQYKETIEYMAYYDELTGLPNRRLFKEKLSTMVKQNPEQKVAVILVDIDRFKMINESLGYTFGDKLLTAIGQKLAAMLPKEMMLARYYGEKFTLLLPLQSNDLQHEIKQTCDYVQEIFTTPISIETLQFRVFVNLGTAIYPAHGEHIEEIFQHANTAMSEAKQSVERCKIYAPSMSDQLVNRLVLENDLHQALFKDQFQLVYQPQVDLGNQQIFAVEALLRWQHPERGYISPAEFIPIAEESGMIIPIGEWVLRTACQQLKEWHDQGQTNLSIAVNLSVRQFYQDNLVEMVTDVLQESQLPANFLEVELTESMAMKNIEHSLKILQRLKDLGVRIAVDDFGTGYSSLSYLIHLPFDRLKIDQSFVRDLTSGNEDTATIVALIVSMAQHLEMDVLAEGVEKIEQVKFLLAKNCQKMQGYLFSKPLAPEALIKQLASLEAVIQEKYKTGSS